MSQIKRLRCFVVGCNNEYSSRHLLLTSEPLKMLNRLRGLTVNGLKRINVTFVLKGMRRSPICLNLSMFTQIIGDPASPTEEVSIRVFYEPLQIAFPNMG